MLGFYVAALVFFLHPLPWFYIALLYPYVAKQPLLQPRFEKTTALFIVIVI